MSTLKWISAGPGTHQCKGVLIWLHGLGADGHDFAPVIPSLHLDKALRLRFIFPHAPTMPVTINGGMVMPAWYDIISPAIQQQPDWIGIERSVAQIHELIAGLVAEGVDPSNICIAGFSQGGAIALVTALTAQRPLKGAIILSSYMPSLPVAHQNKQFSADFPIFIGHGSHDDIVPITLGEKTRVLVEQQGAKVTWHAYPMAHQVCEPELQAIGQFLNNLW